MRIKMAISLLLLAIIFPAASVAASTSITVNWAITNPENIVGYRLYYSYNSDMTAKQVGCETSNAAATSLTCSDLNLNPTTVYFTIAAIGTQTVIESAVSSVTIGSDGGVTDPTPDPSPTTLPAPQNLRIVSVASDPSSATSEAVSSDTQSYAINFQPANSPIPDGYSVDSGENFTSAKGYGWTVSPGSLGPRDRNSDAAPDQSYDTSILVDATGVWELALPSGTYSVTICVGDPWFASSTNVISAEGVQIINDTVTNDNKFVKKNGSVTVNDGRLTIAFQGSTPYSQLCWLTVSKQ